MFFFIIFIIARLELALQESLAGHVSYDIRTCSQDYLGVERHLINQL